MDEEDSGDTPPSDNPSMCVGGDNSKIPSIPSGCREQFFLNFLRRIQALTERYLSSVDNTKHTVAIKLGYATSVALELYSKADTSMTHTSYKLLAANHTEFLEAVRELVVHVSKLGDNRSIDGPLAASSISLLKLLSLMLEDNPVEIKRQLEQSKLLQTFIELVIRGMVLTRNKVTKDVLRYTLLILYKCGMEVPLSSDQKSATECREFFVAEASCTMNPLDPEATTEISALALTQIVKYTDTFVQLCKSDQECTLKSKEDVIVQISGLLKILQSLCESKLIAEQVAEKPFVAEAIGQLTRNAEEIPEKPSGLFAGRLIACLVGWTHHNTEVCKQLVRADALYRLTGMLCHKYYDSALENDESGASQVEQIITVIYNCACVKANLVAFHDTDPVRVLLAFARCPNLEIRLLSKLTLSYLQSHVDRSTIQSALKLHTDEIQFIVENLHNAIVENFTGSGYSAEELLQGAVNLSEITENKSKLVNDTLFHTIDKLFGSSQLLRELSMQLLWNLRGRITLETLKASTPHIISALQHIKNSSCLAHCTLSALSEKEPQECDIDSCLLYASGCYQVEKYQECYDWVVYVLKEYKDDRFKPKQRQPKPETRQEVINQVNLLKAKSLFHMYRKEHQSFQQKSRLASEHEIEKYLNDLYKKTKEVILLLGAARDSDHEFSKKEESMILDFAMMDYIKGTNKLNDCRRCLLCREKRSLKRSHLWPKSLLKKMATESSNTKTYFGSRTTHGRLVKKSAGEITVFMLCAECEQRLCQNCENQFATEFYPLICNEDGKVADGHAIPFKEWLYTFCVSLIFRGMYTAADLPSLLNSTEVYTIFVQCREYLLSFPAKMPTSKCNSNTIEESAELSSAHTSLSNAFQKEKHVARLSHAVKLPEIALLINPDIPILEESEFVAFNQKDVARSFSCSLSKFRLSEGTPVFCGEAHFLHIGLGLCTIVANFKSDLQFPPEFRIEPQGGTYVIPDESTRSLSIPPGVWVEFGTMAQGYDRDILEYNLMSSAAAQIEVPLAGLLTAGADDTTYNDLNKQPQEETFTPKPEAPMLRLFEMMCNPINTLPKGFQIVKFDNVINPYSINLPVNHHIIMHMTEEIDNQRGRTFFLIVSHDGDFSINGFYLLYHLYQPSWQITTGAVVEGDDPPHISRFLYEKTDDQEYQSYLEYTKDILEDALPRMIDEKGFPTFRSIIWRVKSRLLLYGQVVPILDMKCATGGCWYCKGLCHMCMRPATPGYGIHLEGETEDKSETLMHCSEQCRDMTSPNSLSTPMQIKKPNRTDESFVSHCRVLLQVTKVVSTSMCPTLVTVELCSGGEFPNFPEGRVYAMVQLRACFVQGITEVFITPNFSPEEVLPHLSSHTDAIAMIEGLKADDIIRQVLQPALDHVKDFVFPIPSALFHRKSPSLDASQASSLQDGHSEPNVAMEDVECIGIANLDGQENTDTKDLNGTPKSSAGTTSSHENSKLCERNVDVQDLQEQPKATSFPHSSTDSSGLQSEAETEPALRDFLAELKNAVDVIRTYIADERSVQIKRDLSPNILGALSSVSSLHQGATRETAKNMSALLAADMQYLEVFYGFLADVFPALKGGVDPFLAQSLVMVHFLISTWTDHSQEICQFIVENGNMMEHIDELCMLRQSSKNPDVIKLFVELNITTICNCAYATNITKYFLVPELDCVSIFEPYANSPFFEVRLHAKILLGHLLPLISERDFSILQLTSADMASFLEAFQTGTTSANREFQCQDSTFSVAEAAHALKALAANPKNSDMIVSKNLVPALATLLSCGDIAELKAGCELVWNILSLPRCGSVFREQLELSEIPLIECLQFLQESEDEALSLLSHCVLFAMDALEEKDISTCLRYAGACYQYAHYSECVDWCEMLARQDNQSMVKCLLGKANFHIYQQMQFELRKHLRLQFQFTSKYQEMHRKCYQLARSTIDLLGTALDENLLIQSDELKMLDLAMLDYIMEAKGGHNRCLLCLKKAKLRKSHYFPKSLLESFCRGVPTPENLKILRSATDHHSLDKSPKQMVYSMFCSNCENILSKHGETQFQPQFFNQIYNTCDPAQPAAEQSIKYEEWLYHFCIGIIFRGLAVYHDQSFFNSDVVYKLFQKCRQCLLTQSPSHSTITSTASDQVQPQVAILINPTKEGLEDFQYGSMRKVLNSPLYYLNVAGPLDCEKRSRPPQLHCFVVHFGVINIVAPLNSAECEKLPSECFINSKGGVFLVPADEKRREKIPKGIWKVFQVLAVQSEEEMLVKPAKAAKDYEQKKLREPNKEVKELFQLVESRTKAVQALGTPVHILPSPIPEVPKVLDFLPDQFLVSPKHEPSSVHLPPGHAILVHRNFSLGNDVGETLFLAVGKGGQYSLEKPYLIYHRFEPGLQLHSAFFVSPADLVAHEFLPSERPKDLMERVEWEIIQNVRSVCHVVLPQVLGEKGIVNCTSLLKRIQCHAQALREMPSFDLKCPEPCWYCSGLCEVCMKPASFGCNIRRSDGTILRFCSQSCQVFAGAYGDKAHVLQVWEPSESVPSPQFLTRYVESTHRELIYMHLQGVLSSGQYCKVNLTLCVGNGEGRYPSNKIYAVYYLRTLTEQQVIEFFLGEDLQPEEPLPYAACGDAESAITKYRSTNEIRNLVSMALTVKSYSSLQALLQRCHQ